MITATDTASAKDETFEITFSSGRDITATDRGVAVLGTDLAKSKSKKVGDTITLRGRDFQVIGIMEKTFTAPDNSAAVPLADAQELYYEDIPAAFRENLDKYTLTNGINVFYLDGHDPNRVTADINSQVRDVKAYAPDEFKKQIEDSMAIFNVIIMGSAFVAVIVGSFSIINTMSMSIIERTKEIGVKKAIGASNRRIIREVVLEAALMGFFGGIVGTILGYGAVRLINAATESSGQVVFLTTPRLAVGAILFSVLIGAVSGLYPAWYAARLDPIKALRSE
jgi:putative ABC transport system permease protein